MSFNYGREKFIFDREWIKLRKQYTQAGMTEEAIQELYDFDWSWFRMRRNYANHVQAFPEEEIDEVDMSTVISTVFYRTIKDSSRIFWALYLCYVGLKTNIT